jgi:type VI secretion system secreted protein Hcp
MAFDAFLKIDGIPGESLDRQHKDEIEIESFSWGLSNTGSIGSGGGAGAGKAVLQDFHFTSKLSKASPLLLKACATGQHLKEALLTVRRGGGEGRGGNEYLKIKLSDILVSSLAPAGEATDEFPSESFSLNFLKIDYLYTVRRTGEVVETRFDQGQGKIG